MTITCQQIETSPAFSSTWKASTDCSRRSGYGRTAEEAIGCFVMNNAKLLNLDLDIQVNEQRADIQNI